ncbi:MAG TPA: right-handed parallel beta-helix repeat-containing protein, partial [Phycisphaerae bacterium]|nr:right-handed parallel beta-helix repeat-containing protein [Phycisphaerae bacterium]
MVSFMACTIGLLLLICLSALPAGAGVDPGRQGAAFFVSPDGSDGRAGTESQPFATLERARRAVRELKDRGLPKGGACVYLRGGIYRLSKPFALTRADSGTKDAPIRYCRYEGEDARIIGGMIIPSSALGPVTDGKVRSRLDPAYVDHILVADLKALGLKTFEPWPDATRNGRGMMELFFNGKPMQVARWPNEGWVTVKKVLDGGGSPGHGKRISRGGKFEYEGDRPKRWKASKGVWLSGYWCYDWYDEAVRIKSIDTDNRTITLAAPHHYGLGEHPGRRYYALNLLEELDAPGEWYLDVERGLLYFRPPAEIGKAEIILSIMDKPLFAIEGASYVTLDGLTLEAARASAVTVTGGCGNRVMRCLIRNTGAEAVTVAGGNDNGVVGCEITQTGGGGIYIDGGD